MHSHRDLALVTGATAGLGLEFCRQLAASGHDLVLVARDAQRLQQTADALAGEFGVVAQILPADLSDRAQLATVEARLSATEHPVTVLVNNAGFGLTPPFDANPVGDEQRHLDLLVAAPMRLAHAALQQMLARSSGTIISVASVAGYTPRGTYGAAKAWVLSFSRWANIHYRRRGVTVTAVAPGFVRTEFHQRMNARTDNIPEPLWLDAPRVVRSALRAASRGRAVVVPSLRYKIIVWFAGWLPKRLVAAGALRGR
ncbi:SDR family NAD(P)-dependent oxidoreductase [Homoserinimonas aerilata]|nr:SDR family NAD(P)-dependent oxidoreductase [Homoserinimonas aerilata]